MVFGALTTSAMATSTLAVNMSGAAKISTSTVVTSEPMAAAEARQRLQMETEARRQREIEEDRGAVLDGERSLNALRLEQNLRARLELEHSTPRGTTTGPALPPRN